MLYLYLVLIFHHIVIDRINLPVLSLSRGELLRPMRKEALQ